MIPRALSGETNQDSEPNVTVNPANPRNLAASAFTPNPFGGANAPIYVSSDGGQTWLLNAIVPSQNGAMTADITLRFATMSNNLYAGILRRPNIDLAMLRTADFLGAQTMTVLTSRGSVDQPYVEARSDGAPGGDHVFVGINDFNAASGRTATIDVSSAAQTPPPSGFSSMRIEARTPVGQDGPSIRPTWNRDGTVYGAFFHWTGASGGQVDIVVVRDDKGGAGGFNDLKDPSDGRSGRFVATGVRIPFENFSHTDFGQERQGSNLTVVVDPVDSNRVYVAWADKATTTYTLHVRRSVDRGVTWSGDIRTVPNATNPALAISASGVLGFLYQEVTGTSGPLSGQRWVTHLLRTRNDFGTTDDRVLATVPAGTPVRQFLPYNGDYVHLLALDTSFHGVFSANNTPDLANFPQGVTYQRNADFAGHRLLALNNTTQVNVSIDPFYVAVLPEVLQLTATTSRGGLWHTIRQEDGSWQPFFGDVKGVESNDPGHFVATACAGARGGMHLVGLTHNGGMWHTIRFADGSGWQPSFGDVKAQESNDPGHFGAVGCAAVSGELHVVGLTNDGKMWHTIRHADGSWTPAFGDVKGQESNDPGHFTAVGCAGVNGELHVVGLTDDGKMWHTIRHADGSWQPFFGDVKGVESNDPGYFTSVGCAGVNGELHVVALTGDGGMWHTIRLAGGTGWQPFFGDVKGVESNDPGYFTATGCAGVNGELQVLGLTEDGKMWHTIRHADGSWVPSFGDVKAQESNDPGHFVSVGCAGVD
ncbi:hypothetical protein Aiant_13630 [Actinoplanes ianthinogenes]|uniref:Exo-alpha-sialidase n=2 Tax=Actinoplanes ianthinogenes TaxID=122358 RepID=A0ABM7LN81_9ACTN|nr:hypothetical protein Aiant_13630 [Actinoplanes ianthinogenes]